MITHLVLMKLKQPSDAAFVSEKVLSLEGKIPGLLQVSGGASVITTPMTWDLGFTMNFDRAETVMSYQSHPVHVEVGAAIRDLLQEMATCDLEA